MIYAPIPDINCYFNDTDLNYLRTAHAHYGYEIYLVTSGEATFYVNQKQYHLTKKSIVFISRLERHSFMAHTLPYQRYIMFLSSDFVMANIKDTRLLSIFLHRPDDFCHVQPLSDAIFDRIYPYFLHLAEECAAQSTYYKLKSAALVTELLIDLYRTYPQFFPLHSHNSISEIVLNVQKFVNDHYERPITLQEIASKNFISRQTLSGAFKEIVGCTFKDYLTQFRISEAKRLLVTTSISIADIAEKVGYQNVNNFIQIFKHKEAITPLQYRKQCYPDPQTDINVKSHTLQ